MRSCGHSLMMSTQSSCTACSLAFSERLGLSTSRTRSGVPSVRWCWLGQAKAAGWPGCSTYQSWLAGRRVSRAGRPACICIIEPADLQGLQAGQRSQTGRQPSIDQAGQAQQAMLGQGVQSASAQALRLTQVQLCQVPVSLPPADDSLELLPSIGIA